MNKEERINEIEIAANIESVLKIHETTSRDLTRALHNHDASESILRETLEKLLKGTK